MKYSRSNLKGLARIVWGFFLQTNVTKKSTKLSGIQIIFSCSFASTMSSRLHRKLQLKKKSLKCKLVIYFLRTFELLINFPLSSLDEVINFFFPFYFVKIIKIVIES